MTKVCPLCGSRFGQEVERCPDDGRILIRVRKSADSADNDNSVKLSSATEELLGDILTSTSDQEVKGGSGSSNSLAELDFDIDLELGGEPSSSSKNPLDDLDLDNFSISEPFSSIQRKAGEVDDEDEDDAASRSANDLFGDLALEVDALIGDEDVGDDEVTRRVTREDIAGDDSTRRSEMPPEFAEALAREREEDAEKEETAPKKDKKKKGKKGKDDEPKIQRELPRHSQLHVQSTSYVLSSERRRLPLIPIAIALVITVAVLLIVWFATA